MNALEQIEKQLHEAFGVRAILGAELECYVELAEDQLDAFWKPIHEWLHADVPFKRIEKERGLNQFEVVLGTAPAADMVAHLQALKSKINEQAKALHVTAEFAPKPNADEPSSGMHLHVHLENDEKQNVFFKTEDETSEALGQALAGMLGTIPLAMDIWCPTTEGHARYADVDHVPRTLSWGMNNRYSALRIPATINPFKVVEHRMCGADANPEKAITALLAGILVGFEQELLLPEQEFGKPAHRAPAEWVSFLTPDAQARFLSLIGKAADESRDIGNITTIG